jgi:hypothetical protein
LSGVLVEGSHRRVDIFVQKYISGRTKGVLYGSHVDSHSITLPYAGVLYAGVAAAPGHDGRNFRRNGAGRPARPSTSDDGRRTGAWQPEVAADRFLAQR